MSNIILSSKIAPRRRKPKALCFALLFIALIFQSVTTLAQDEQSSPSLNILLLSSYTQNYQNAIDFEAGFDQALNFSSYENNVYFEYFDAARIPDEDASINFAEHLRSKYSTVEFDYIIVWHLSAISFVQQNPDLFPADKLIYFEGDGLSAEEKVNIPTQWLDIFQDFTPAVAEIDRFYQPEKLYVVIDLSDINGQSRLDLFEASRLAVFPDIEVEYLIDMPLTDTIDILQQPQAKRAAVIYLLTFVNVNGEPASPTSIIPYLAERSEVPIFTFWSAAINKGIVGGLMFSHQAAAQSLGNKLLEAQAPSSATSQEPSIDTQVTIYDWNALQQWDIDTSRLPENAQIINKPVSIFYLYRNYIIAIAVVFSLLTGLSLSLARAVISRNQLLKELELERTNLEVKVDARTEELAQAVTGLNAKNLELTKSLEEIKTLKGIIPICSFCKNVRDDKGYWKMVESYITTHSDVSFSHSVCPECVSTEYPEFT